jgi:Fic family protein
MSDLEKFLHNDRIHIPALIRIAIAHYQFETIHPFLDGNGRVGRLLITLYLVSEGVLARPTLYLSAFFDKHLGFYYDNLEGVRRSDGMLRWISFFLVGVTEIASEGISTLKGILDLKEDIEERRIKSLGKRIPQARNLLKYLYRSPAVTASDVGKALKVTPATANTLIRDFVGLGILQEVTGGRRNRVFTCREYLDLFMKGKE